MVKGWIIVIEDRITTKPPTLTPRTSRPVLGPTILISENSRDIFMHIISPPPLPLKGGRSLRSMV